MLMPSPDREAHDGYIARYLRTGEPHIIGIGREVRARRRDGTTFPIALAVSEMHVDGRRMFTGIVHDLTARVQAEEALRQARDELEVRVRERTAELEAANKVFEPFRRVGRQDVPGEGVGLAYVRMLVRRHGGESRCHSTLGVGTTLTFTIAHQHPGGAGHAD
jgi:PAS domain-containing protein